MITRREFTGRVGRAGLATALGGAWLGLSLPRVAAAETRLPERWVRFRPEVEPLVKWLEETPRERVIEEAAQRIRRGLSYRDLVTALFLAGLRNIQPRPIGFKFHAVLVVHASHLSALAAPDSERWLPILWALDQFKSSQARDIAEGDWALGAVDESKVPASHRAREAFREAMEAWDEPAADVAIAGLVRSAPAHEIFELMVRYGIRDFRELGHKLIYIVNAFRTLEVIGWQHAEPVLRGVTFAILDRVGDSNPSKGDLPADRPFRRNVRLVAEIRKGWVEGRADGECPRELIRLVRQAAAPETSRWVVDTLGRGVGPESVFDALHVAAADLLGRQPGIFSLHAHTFTNAVHYAWQQVRDDELRRLLLLQNAAFHPLFRGEVKPRTFELDTLVPEATQATDPAAGLEEVFAHVGAETATAARKLLGWLERNPDAGAFADAARRLIFAKGRDAHDYKFSAAVLEDAVKVDPAWRARFLAASVYNLQGSKARDTELVGRVRAAMGA